MPLVVEYEPPPPPQHAVGAGPSNLARYAGSSARHGQRDVPIPPMPSGYPTIEGALALQSSPSHGDYPRDHPRAVYQGASDMEIFASIDQMTSDGPILLTRLGSRLNINHDCRGRGKKWLVPLLKNNPLFSRHFVVFDPHEDEPQCSKCSRLLVAGRQWFEAQATNLYEDVKGSRSRQAAPSRRAAHEDADSEAQIFASIDRFIGDTPSISVQLATLGAFLRRKHDLTGRGKKWLVPFLRQSNRFVVFDPHGSDPDLRNQQLFVRRNLDAN